jgi:NTE family protein
VASRFNSKTASVFDGSGSLGAVEVGMLKALTAHGVNADLVVGSSVGAINAAFLAGEPTAEGARSPEEIWRGGPPARRFPHRSALTALPR